LGVATTWVVDRAVAQDIGAADKSFVEYGLSGPSLQRLPWLPIGPLGCDANGPHRLADFWAHALGYVKEAGCSGGQKSPLGWSASISGVARPSIAAVVALGPVSARSSPCRIRPIGTIQGGRQL